MSRKRKFEILMEYGFHMDCSFDGEPISDDDKDWDGDDEEMPSNEEILNALKKDLTDIAVMGESALCEAHIKKIMDRFELVQVDEERLVT
jgi:hypothetical protein